MASRAKMNAVRSGVVVLGALAFGWLSMELAYKPILNKARVTLEQEKYPLSDHSRDRSDSSGGGAAPESSFQQEELLDVD